MNAESTRPGAVGTDEIWKWTVGMGILAVALFPLAIPLVVLTAVAIVPLLVPLIALGLLAGLIASPLMLLRRLRRRRSADSGELAPEAPATKQLHHTGRLGVRPG
jgi:Flp pilus assembly protein TadB